MASDGAPFPQGTEFWNPDKQWDDELFESLAERLGRYGLRPAEVTLPGQTKQLAKTSLSFDASLLDTILEVARITLGDGNLFEWLCDQMNVSDLKLRQAMAQLDAYRAANPAHLIFTKCYSIQQALNWQTYKTCLRWYLLDITAADDDCPQAIKESTWEGDVEVDGDELIYQGDPAG